jgi:hypothetical protein
MSMQLKEKLCLFHQQQVTVPTVGVLHHKLGRDTCGYRSVGTLIGQPGRFNMVEALDEAKLAMS